MKKLIVILLVIVSFQVQAQLLPPWPIHTNWTDGTSSIVYKKILDSHEEMTLLNTKHWLAVEAVTMAIIEKHDRLFIAGSPLAGPIRTDVDRFINVDARGYYYYKYPIASPYALYNQNMFKNLSIQNRYTRKLNSERTNIQYYLGIRKTGVTHELRIPEGERVLLTLQALGKIINYTLENETY